MLRPLPLRATKPTSAAGRVLQCTPGRCPLCFAAVVAMQTLEVVDACRAGAWGDCTAKRRGNVLHLICEALAVNCLDRRTNSVHAGCSDCPIIRKKYPCWN